MPKFKVWIPDWTGGLDDDYKEGITEDASCPSEAVVEAVEAVEDLDDDHNIIYNPINVIVEDQDGNRTEWTVNAEVNISYSSMEVKP